MRNIQRTIDEVRAQRGDLSTWLVHLTKGNFSKINGQNTYHTPKQCLENIIKTNTIEARTAAGHFNYSAWYKNVNPKDLRAVSFTETPLRDIFLFINIKNKSLKFSSYGLVFDRDELTKKPIYAAPVMYFSQPDGDSHFLNKFSPLEQKFCHDFKDVLYLFDKFGKTFTKKDFNFMWEREWRIRGDFKNITEHVKFGLCPESEIAFFEKMFPAISFVDPFFNPRQIEAKLKARGII